MLEIGQLQNKKLCSKACAESDSDSVRFSYLSYLMEPNKPSLKATSGL